MGLKMGSAQRKIVHIGGWNQNFEKTYTIDIERFFYYIPRVKLSIIEGYYTEEPNKWTNETIEDAPKKDVIVSMTFRPDDLKEVAKQIMQICEQER
jgi:hypothetical protein